MGGARRMAEDDDAVSVPAKAFRVCLHMGDKPAEILRSCGP